MIRFEPGPQRSELGFSNAVVSSFEFLANYGFRRVSADATTVCYEKRFLLGLNRLFVSVHHGHGSYELSVWVGRKCPAKHRVDLFEIVRWARAEEAEGLGRHTTFQVSSREGVEEVVPKLAELVRKYAVPFLQGDKRAFESVLKQRQQESQDYVGRLELDRMREKAEIAWHRKDFGAVVTLYQLFPDRLEPFEVKRLDYARKRRE